METEKTIYKSFIEEVIKSRNSRQFNLEETYNLMCNTEHEVSYAHDPVTNVIYTKCIFNILLNVVGPHNLIRKCM